MARSRNIKPGLYKNEDLAECSIWARYIFPGLWMIADREGRLENRPKRIKGELLPFDSQDAEPLLKELSDKGFILQYEVDGKAYIQIPMFKKHQNPHHREKESEIPPPQSPGVSSLAKTPKSEALPLCNQSNTSDKPEIQRPTSDFSSGLNPADSLIPDSLIPDSLNSDANASVVASKLNDADAKKETGIPDCPQRELLALYAEILPTLPQPRAWEGQRANNLKARWRWALTAKTPKGNRYATDKDSALDFFRRFFECVADSDFLCGRNRKWLGCNLAWLVKAENFAKVIEGQYDNREVS